MEKIRHCDAKEAIRLAKVAANFTFYRALREFSRVRRRVGEQRYDSIVAFIARSW